MKILTILGTRPEIIRLSRIIPRLDAMGEQILVHTGQNYDHALDGVFFEELAVRPPDHHLGARGSFGQQLGAIVSGLEQILERERPDRFLVLGDTNSSLGAIAAKRLGVPVYHMEAGNRCHDDRVPEEVNRRLIDHSSDVLLPYTRNSKDNLMREGIPAERIYVTGNPIFEVINHHQARIEASSIHDTLGIERGRYLLVTLHRAENVDVRSRLSAILGALRTLRARHDMPVIVSTHPRTQRRLAEYGLGADDPGVRLLTPFGFADFVALERHARCVLSDSGTVQEECAILRVPTVTLRDVTERPETLECGSNVLSGADTGRIVTLVDTVLAAPPSWSPPEEYVVPDVAERVVRIVTSHRRFAHQRDRHGEPLSG
ncbi:MAG: non-hydrolyzing UDP-N-acetylglucosamine 2-epimerase [Gemmatimonas sp.]|uniref:non-hydrolyzing UDP-N-acetylglucosamine 2-epimerase n=1 Tax=Gemmatimonas sp. TaxID=1962908 RepID=UPI00391F72CF|nr:UDP-N-acetylglucosamine 2-epimerase (non-hydrolyzing) [Gemmatimonadota bacterium]